MHPPYADERMRARILALNGYSERAIQNELLEDFRVDLRTASILAHEAWTFANPSAA